MKKLLVLLCFAALCCSGMTGALAVAPAAPEWSPDDTPPMQDDVASAAAHARASHCKTPSCKAIIVIDKLVPIAWFEAGDANGRASILGYGRPQIAGRRLDRILLRHPGVYGPVCATDARLISRFRLGPGVYEMIVPVQLLMSSVDMDLRNHGNCAQDLLAALTKDPANKEVRLTAQSLCVNCYENHYRPKAACDVLIHGLKAEQ